MVIFTCIFVLLTVAITGTSTFFLTYSLLSNEWEFISYKTSGVEEVARTHNHSLRWMEDGQLGRLEIPDDNPPPPVKDRYPPKGTVVYLVPAYGGVNSLCPNISDRTRAKIKEDGYNLETCISYLSNEKIISRDAWLDRMRNLAMSCAMVCLILIGFSAPLGILGLLKQQISTIMVTGVMYILAGVFGVFNLAFMHFKRVKPDGFYTSTILDKNLPEDYMKQRIFTVGWPPAAEWAGLILCLIGSLFWLLLAKIYSKELSRSSRKSTMESFMAPARQDIQGSRFYTSTILDKNLPEDYMKQRIFTVGWPPVAECSALILRLIGSLFWLAKIYSTILDKNLPEDYMVPWAAPPAAAWAGLILCLIGSLLWLLLSKRYTAKKFREVDGTQSWLLPPQMYKVPGSYSYCSGN
ncbi:hypothetical protein JTE90_009110 [Oedothorax gibbosus]|uniref:Uncharacterized protein n=1 Tax=Oedothorax gibbosus TaxID=931172 RepID=A0AAV6UEH5_9ARAC|nr:hypothetical protein JTE90_009110 [Oedothorax gibbosus]